MMQGYCIVVLSLVTVGSLVVTAVMRSWGRWLASRVASAILVAPLMRWYPIEVLRRVANTAGPLPVRLDARLRGAWRLVRNTDDSPSVKQAAPLCSQFGVGEAWVDAGGAAPDQVEVGTEFGEFGGVGVQDPAVRAVGLLPAGESSLLAPLVDGGDGDAEFGGEVGSPPFVLGEGMTGADRQWCAPVGDVVASAAQDLVDGAPADPVVVAAGVEAFLA